MVDVVTSQTLFDGERIAIMAFTNVSDGTGETAVLKVDVSALAANARGKTCDGVTLEKVHASINGMSVSILWDATTDLPALIVAPGMYTFDFCNEQIQNLTGTGKTGDILFTTIGASASDTYSIILQMVKHYT